MTMPHEKTWALKSTKQFLRELLDPKATPRVPKAIRERAYRCLKHFPWEGDLDKSQEILPEVWGKKE